MAAVITRLKTVNASSIAELDKKVNELVSPLVPPVTGEDTFTLPTVPSLTYFDKENQLCIALLVTVTP